MTVRARAGIAACLLVAVAACAGGTPRTPVTPPSAAATPTVSPRSADPAPSTASAGPSVELAGTAWTVIALDTGPVPLDAGVELAFTDSAVSGNSGCNSFGGPYRRTASGIVFGAIGTTKRACPSPVGDREHALYAALPLVRSMRPSSGELLLLDADGATRIHLRPGVGVGG